jgi:hypothetical protein
MAKTSIETIETLRKTALRIEKSQHYQWGHMGSCNCGFLAQVITNLSKDEIHTSAMEGFGDWTEQLQDYCPTSGLKMDELIRIILAFGFTRDDLKYLERLSDPRVLGSFPFTERNLRFNIKADVIRYLLRWADLIENELLEDLAFNVNLLASFASPLEDNIRSNPLVHYPG